MYSITFRGGIISSVLVVKPENSKKGINTIGDISTAILRLGMIVPKNIPIIIPNRLSKIQTSKKPRNYSAVFLKPTIKYTIHANTEGKRAVRGISIKSFEV